MRLANALQFAMPRCHSGCPSFVFADNSEPSLLVHTNAPCKLSRQHRVIARKHALQSNDKCVLPF
eukprot:5921506-Amphidinium_carterae.2